MSNKYSGFLLVDKEIGPTSFGIIHQLRKITGIKKIGHAGTLDPFASGLLIVAIGRQATRKIYQFVKLDKEYEANLVLGATTNTYDNEGEITRTENFNQEEVQKNIETVLKNFLGAQEQIPPMFSAKKVGGKKLYDLARKGIEVERKPSKIEIFEIELISQKGNTAKIRVKCSSGTYIRTLAHDIGQDLGCGAYLDGLRRTKIGDFDVKDAKKIEELNEKSWEDYLFEKEQIPQN